MVTAMAATSDERREVAERLRMCARETNGTYDFTMYLSHWVGFDGVTDDEGKHFTIAADRKEAELTLERLADLIDPTCEVDSIEPVGYGEFNQAIGSAFHLTCGHTVMRALTDTPPAYCEECGARVVSDDE